MADKTIQRRTPRSVPLEAPTDFEINDQGTLVLFRACTAAAKEWFRENVHAEPYQFFGSACAVDHRCARNLVNGIEAEGFVISAQ